MLKNLLLLNLLNVNVESVCFFGVVFVFVCPVFIYRKCDRGCAFFQTLDLNIVFIEVERHFAATAGNGNWFIRNLNFQGSTFLCGSSPCSELYPRLNHYHTFRNLPVSFFQGNDRFSYRRGCTLFRCDSSIRGNADSSGIVGYPSVASGNSVKL